MIRDFERGRAAAAAGLGRGSGWGGESPASDLTQGPSPIQFGYYLDRRRRRTFEPLLYDLPLHCILIGLNGAGKQTRILTPLYMCGRGFSQFIVETKGTAALQTAHERRLFSKTKIVCPFPVLGLKSDGWNPLLYMDPKSPYFLGDALALARAMIDIETGTGKHWTESATGLLAALIMWEVIEARRQNRAPSLLRVRMRLTEPNKWEPYTNAEGKPRKRLAAGLSLTAARMIEKGGPIIKSLVGRFLREHGRDEIASIQSTADTETQFLLNPFIAADLAKGKNVDLTQLSQERMSVYWVCAAGELDEFRRHTRMGLAFAVRAQLRRPPRLKCLYVLDEYRSTVGKLGVVSDNWALVREWGIQFFVCIQSAIHLEVLHGKEFGNMLAQSGLLATIGPVNEEFTAELLSKRCGTTTELVRGFNIAEGISTGDNPSGSTGVSNGGPSSNEGWGLQFGGSRTGTFTVQQVERPAVRPQELMDLRPGEGRLWLQGMGTRSFPFYAPHYFERREPWVARVGDNPYFRGNSSR
jgi:hypothetical protein